MYHLNKSNNNEQYYFTLRAGNGERILVSEMYNSKQGAQNGIASCKTNSAIDLRYQKLTAANGQFYFRLRAANNEVIGVSEMYTTAASRDKGIESCKSNGPSSATQDNT